MKNQSGRKRGGKLSDYCTYNIETIPGFSGIQRPEKRKKEENQTKER